MRRLNPCIGFWKVHDNKLVERMLSSEPGMHRFVWNMHYPAPDSLDHDYPISAIYRDTPRYPLGPPILPGVYEVKLTVDGDAHAQSLTVKMDPRVKASVADLEAQFALGTKIVGAMHRDFVALSQVRSVRSSLKSLQQSSGAKVPASAGDFDKTCSEIEGTEGGFGATFLSTPAGRGLVRLNEALNNLLGVVDSADTAPTAQAASMFEDVSKALDEQLARWDGVLKNDVPRLNTALKKAGLSPIEVK